MEDMIFHVSRYFQEQEHIQSLLVALDSANQLFK